MIDPGIDIGEYGVWLKGVRNRMALSQAGFAKRTGITTQHQKLLENGFRYPGPTLRLLQNMIADNIALPPAPDCTAPRQALKDER